MTDKQLSIILNLIADRLVNEVVPEIEGSIRKGDRLPSVTLEKYEWIGEKGKEPISCLVDRKYHAGYKDVSEVIEGDLWAVHVVKYFAEELRDYVSELYP